jgi:hypothetical protein
VTHRKNLGYFDNFGFTPCENSTREGHTLGIVTIECDYARLDDFQHDAGVVMYGYEVVYGWERVKNEAMTREFACDGERIEMIQLIQKAPLVRWDVANKRPYETSVQEVENFLAHKNHVESMLKKHVGELMIACQNLVHACTDCWDDLNDPVLVAARNAIANEERRMNG